MEKVRGADLRFVFSLHVLLQRSEHLLRVSVRFHFGKNLLYPPLLVNQERRALDPQRRSPVHVLLFQHAEGFAELLVFVGQQAVRKAIFILELLLSVG